MTKGSCRWTVHGARAVAATGAVTLVLSITSGPSARPMAEEASATQPLRAMWKPSDAPFLRSWHILGPLPTGMEDHALALPGGEAGLRPGEAPVPVGDARLRWTVTVAWSDVVDVAGALGRRLYRGAAAAPETAFAYTTLLREREGPALLSVGADGRSRIWVNGAPVLDREATSGLLFDATPIPVALRRGENRILIKLEHHTGPWRFTARVLERGAQVAPLLEIVPSLVVPTPTELVVRTDAEGRSPGADVEVAVVGAGGRVVASRNERRGTLLRLDPRAWSEGAYEIRFVTRTAIGERFARHVPWYRGDAAAAAARLVEAARSAPRDARGAHLRMLADLAVDRAGGHLGALPDDAWPLLHSALLEHEELEQAERGSAGPVRPWGFVRLAYLDDVDGSTQFCRVFLPPDYDTGKRSPLVVSLHGFNPPNPPYVGWWSIDERHQPTAERHGVIWLEPHGRGNAQYIGIGERDVLRCLAEVRARLSVDDDRVYLTGESMGGSGTWLLASRHPDLFAAAAPVFGGWDYRVVSGFGFNFANPRATAVPERFVQEAHSSFAGVESLLNVPLWVHHGDQDRVVDMEHSRHVVRMLQRWGYDVRYEEHPGGAHEDLKARDRIVSWMLRHRRVAAPRTVRIRALDLGGASAYWARVEAWEAPLRPMQVDAEILRPGFVRVDSRNAAAIVLALPPESRGDGNELRVAWNGEERVVPLSAAGEARLSSPDDREREGALQKRPGFEGRLSNIFTTPFAVVVGTASSDREMQRLCREKADVFAELWTRWQHFRPRVLLDSDVTPEDERDYSLLLIGGPDANLVTSRFAARLPLRVDRDAVVIDGRRAPASDAVVQLIYPSPAQPSSRYVLVVAGTSAAGMYFWNPAGFWHQTFGFQTLAHDWTLQDGRRVTLENGLGSERGWLAAGVFDRYWRRDDRWVFLGDESLRARSPLRRPAAPGFAVATRVLDAYVGRYELAPGYTASVTREGSRLSVGFPGATPEALIPERRGEFAIRSNGVSVEFRRGADGRVSALTINNGGQETTAKKVE